MSLTAFPTETVSVVPAHVSVDYTFAGRGDRYEHHFFVACRTTRENRWDAVRRDTYCGHVRTSLVSVRGAGAFPPFRPSATAAGSFPSRVSNVARSAIMQPLMNVVR